MIELFMEYKNSSSYTEALLLGRNLFNKNPDNITIFNEYFNLLCLLASDASNSITDRRQYISQAEVCLAFFSENAELDKAAVEDIKIREKKLTTLVSAFNDEVDKQNAAMVKEAERLNDEKLTLLEKLVNKLQNTTEQKEFDKVVGQIGDIDNILGKDSLDKPRQERYTRLTQRCTGIIKEKMSAFEKQKNVDYNLRAIEAYQRTFNFFKTNDHENNKHAEIMKNFFAFDTSRLFNETLVYYNHVYSYILSKMNDDEKFILTECAIISERKGV